MAMPEEQLVRLIADPETRAILSCLDDASAPLTVDELTHRLVERDTTVVDATTYDRELDRTALSLHHSQLPQLKEAGLVEYDADENLVSTRDDAIDPEWLTFDLIDEFLSRFAGRRSTDTDAIGVIEGAGAVYDYSRELADRAEDELFLIYRSDDLLDEGCLPHATQAMDRGVEFCVGSQNADVRQFFREHVPETTIWEPQLDWMNEPSRYPRISRLIVADRDKVMLSLRDKPVATGSKAETAMIGEGETNPLVVLVRELLGPRLDHLDYQSDHFSGELPFEL
ncbi:uncharacterized protein Nmag_2170 [Natrialba magadii ATCC 43099]|uniref:DUF7344 domain-containing protein n=1 Tax=Natrialba magadii (strain ATCC 43099 / DSM 3394 / CCM 3739 / CIP 104546 / IAM 13178 / JCM 8861 / NBRC 102185 / NCIMB 2190 / MS3) TaxID=547559 RepID=D3SW76_NATMM|nr:hypothetical protein [Natrialba magadii]ADD05737.1 uncharacterized protein Nmag_2170 [Natrialba magadii ATCC 43099]ELY29850.1 hypothetical protein C500_09569 [Natrialba magadii ATCC 43099]